MRQADCPRADPRQYRTSLTAQRTQWGREGSEQSALLTCRAGLPRTVACHRLDDATVYVAADLKAVICQAACSIRHQNT